LLVENAVKHNIVSKDKPLEVRIKIAGDETLCVENNVQKKTITVQSTGIGLSNINSKFMLLNQKGLHIEKTPDRFTVFVPLMQSEA
jgi:LytS/YehU family sensor histidine kinase